MTCGSACLRRTRRPRTLRPQNSFSTNSGYMRSAGSRSSSETKMCTCSPEGGAVAKIFRLTRKDVYSKCGSSVASGKDSANRRTSSSVIRCILPRGPCLWNRKWPKSGRFPPAGHASSPIAGRDRAHESADGGCRQRLSRPLVRQKCAPRSCHSFSPVELRLTYLPHATDSRS